MLKLGSIVDVRTVTASYHGSSNFAIEALDKSGQEQDVLVNTIGNYSGTTLLTPSDGTAISAFKVTASGAWTVKVSDITKTKQWNGKSKLSGTGDSVFIIPGGTDGATTVAIAGHGKENFVVISYGNSGENVLVNEIGSWSGRELLPPNTVAVAVQYDGSWSIAP